MTGALSRTPKCGFDSWARHGPWLQVHPLVGVCIWEAANPCFSPTSLFLSLFVSPPLPHFLPLSLPPYKRKRNTSNLVGRSICTMMLNYCAPFFIFIISQGFHQMSDEGLPFFKKIGGHNVKYLRTHHSLIDE